MMLGKLRIAMAFGVHNVEARAAPPFHIVFTGKVN